MRASTRPPQKLIGRSGNDRNPDEAGNDEKQETRHTKKAEKDNGTENDDQEKAGTTTGMFGRVLGHRVDAQRLAGLIGMDRHVLGAVVFEYAGDFLRSADGPDVSDKKPESDKALENIEQDARFAGDETGGKRG